MPELQRLGPQHAAAVLAFEQQNRAFFARTIADRGDAYFAGFPAGFRALLAEQDTGGSAFHLLVEDDGSVLGRFNLTRIRDGAAHLGYRVAEHAGGRGLATAGVGALCAAAADRLGLRVLRAAAAHANPASRRVLVKNGFEAVHEADPAELGGQSGTWFERHLAPER